MADFSTLKSYVANWLNRNDLSTEIGLFINMTIRKFENDPRWNWKYMRSSATGSLARLDYTLALPANYKSTQVFFIIDTDNALRPLRVTSLSHAYSEYPWRADYQDFPKYIAIDDANSQIVIRPTIDQTYTYEWRYHKFSDELSDDTDTNWMTTNHYELVLYGALKEAALFINDTDAMIKYSNMYEEEKKRLIDTQIDQDWDGSPLEVISDYVV
jgi:hypothetical protein